MSSSDSTIRRPGQHLTPEQMRDYRRRSLALDELVVMHKHLGECGACRRALRLEAGQIQIPAAALAIQEPLHLSYEELVSYMEKKADQPARERAEAHLFLCSSCSRELEGLERLEQKLSVEETPVARVAAAPLAPARVTLRERIAGLFAVPGLGRQLAYGVAAMVAGFLVLYRTGMGMAPESGVRGAARIFAPVTHVPSGIGLGGALLMSGGAAYLFYVLFRKK